MVFDKGAIKYISEKAASSIKDVEKAEYSHKE